MLLLIHNIQLRNMGVIGFDALSFDRYQLEFENMLIVI